MRIYSLLLLFFILILLPSCRNATEKNTGFKAVDTSDSSKSDNITDTDNYLDCNAVFFKKLSTFTDPATINLKLNNGNSMSLIRFKQDELLSDYVRYGLKSIDNDTTPELIVFNNTGGAHCCDEIYIFEKDADSYLQKARLFGGFICIDPASNIFNFSFNETLGYFFSCYACSLEGNIQELKTIREIELKYNDSRFIVLNNDPEKEKELLSNLDILKNHGYEELDQGLMDNGWRKEFAMNFAVWHYTHGKNWAATKSLFDKYYTFKDADRVWIEFYNSLTEAEKENSF
jgi:hypothetical protein